MNHSGTPCTTNDTFKKRIPCRMGVDPMSSVLDVNCKAHDLGNLYVVDASFFVSSGAVNPSLTIIANGIRIALTFVAEAQENIHGKNTDLGLHH